ncbi:Tetratricopeptide repeat-containing protein [Paenibacillus sp. 1_12]|uniref:tetratricopeptide repeat protein n=1 Tax=Paenibacillus sp. 1_12 TaxID=1566278 RepID=UPI0008F06A38|nr:tetratricopeptide repeat protein [Paenibacillus sp. 1_12]SFL31748.1 Tetratricopeptide repeat-containing protein [Paenibacillus sp. 1_12]
MKALIKPLLVIVGIIIIVIIAFNISIWIGFGLIAAIFVFTVYTSRANLYALRGSRAFAKGETPQALDWYKKASNSKPCPDKHRIGYGYLLMRSGDPKQAEQVFKPLLKATKSRDTLVQAQSNLATAYWLQGKRDEAIALLTDVLKEYKNTLVYGNLGYFKILHGDLEEALTFNLEASTYNADDLTIQDNIALNYYELGQWVLAEETYQKLMLKAPKYAEPYYYYAQTLRQLGKTNEAIEQINLAATKTLSFVTPLTKEQIEQDALRLRARETELSSAAANNS